MLLLMEVDSITKQQAFKKNAFRVCGTGCVKIVFILLTEVVVFYIQTFIVQIRVPNLEDSIPGGRVQLAMLLTLNKQF